MLWDQWTALWERAGATGHRKRPYDRLLERYGEGHRHYHTIEHVQHCLAELAGIRHFAADADSVEMAIWFHDAIYQPGAHDNELRSAELAMTVLDVGGFPPAFASTVANHVRATAQRSPPADADEDVLFDCDLAILGAKPDAFDAYERGIRREYEFVAEALFRERRARILQGFLDRGTIYATGPMRAKYETAARANLARSIARLTGNGPLP